eukprot:jgi/Mesvir1/18092/Mv09393-RA.1
MRDAGPRALQEIVEIPGITISGIGSFEADIARGRDIVSAWHKGGRRGGIPISKKTNGSNPEMPAGTPQRDHASAAASTTAPPAGPLADAGAGADIGADVGADVGADIGEDEGEDLEAQLEIASEREQQVAPVTGWRANRNAWARRFRHAMRVALRIPKRDLEQCFGIFFIFTTKAGFIFSGEVGTGFFVVKLNKGTPHERWSAPSAVTCAGAGWGIQAGIVRKTHIILLRSQRAVDIFKDKARVELGAFVDIALGPLGGTLEPGVIVAPHGLEATMTTSRSLGLFAGVGVFGTLVTFNPLMNDRFFVHEVSVRGVLSGRQGLEAWRYHAELQQLYQALDRATLAGPKGNSYDGPIIANVYAPGAAQPSVGMNESLWSH